MENPFVGMDPFLEGKNWKELHQNLLGNFQKQLNLELLPRYSAQMDFYVRIDVNPQENQRGVYPNVAVVLEDTTVPARDEGVLTADAPTIVTPLPVPTKIRIPYLKVTELSSNRVLTVIELISPVNKSGEARKTFIKKRNRLLRRNINFLEIDLIRRLKPTVEHPIVEVADYFATLHRVAPPNREIWVFDLGQPIPRLPVPLLSEDGDGVIDVQRGLNECYVNAGYRYRIDYTKKPPPPAILPEKMPKIP